MAALKAIDISEMAGNTQISVAGYYSPGDGGGGTFYYDSGSSTTDDGGTVIAPDVGSGRWKRVYSGYVDVKWFGAKCDGTTDDATALTAAISASDVCHVPLGTMKITSSVLLGPGKVLSGASRKSIILVSGSGAIVLKGEGAALLDMKVYADTGYTGTAVTIKGYDSSGNTTRNRNRVMNCMFYGQTALGTALAVTADTASEAVSLYTLRDLLFQGWEYGIRISASVASGSTWANGGVGGGFTFTGQTKYCIDMSSGDAGGTEDCSGNTFNGVQIQTDSTLVKSVYMHGTKVRTNSVTGIHQWDISNAASQPVVDVQSGNANYVEGVFGDETTNYVVSTANLSYVRRNNANIPGTLYIGARKITQGQDAPGIITDQTPGDTAPNMSSKAILRCKNTSSNVINRIIVGEGVSIGRRLLIIGDGYTSLSPVGSGNGKLHSSIGTLLLAANTFYDLVWDGSYWYRVS